MKKIILLLLVFCMLMPFSTAFAAEKEISVYLDGKKLAFDVLPEIVNSRTMVPMRKIFEEMGAEVSWNGANRSINATCGNLKIRMAIDSNILQVNSKEFKLDQPPQIKDSRTLVPLRAVAEAFSAKVDWDGNKRRVDIYSKYPEELDKSLSITLGENYDRHYFDFSSESVDGVEYSVTVKDNKIFFRGGTALFYSADIFIWEGDTGYGLEDASWNTKDIYKKCDFEVVASCRQFTDEKVYLSAWATIMDGNYDGHDFNDTKSFVLEKQNGEYVILQEESPVYQSNKAFVSKWENPVKYIKEITDKDVIALSNKICAGAKNDYDKVLKIHDWVADNIYYDLNAFFTNRITITSVSDVLKHKRTVCAGYANVTEALICAQGIPCRIVNGYALGIGTEGEWTKENSAYTKTNHAWNRAYVDNRWINIDTTWDSGNEYINGDFEKGYVEHKYFDITDLEFSNTHKYIK